MMDAGEEALFSALLAGALPPSAASEALRHLLGGYDPPLREEILQRALSASPALLGQWSTKPPAQGSRGSAQEPERRRVLSALTSLVHTDPTLRFEEIQDRVPVE